MRRVLLLAGLVALAACPKHPEPKEPLCRPQDAIQPRERPCRLWAVTENPVIMPATRVCRVCGDRPVPASCLRFRDYRCSRCRRDTPAARAREARYNQGARKVVNRRVNAKRIFVGREYHSRARTVEQAHAINAHIKERRREFIARQQDRKEAQGAAAG